MKIQNSKYQNAYYSEGPKVQKFCAVILEKLPLTSFSVGLLAKYNSVSNWTAWVAIKKLLNEGVIAKKNGFYYSVLKEIPEVKSTNGVSFSKTTSSKIKSTKTLVKLNYILKTKSLKFTLSDQPKPYKVPSETDDEWVELWGIDRNIKLSRECADFYTLYDLSLDHEEVKPEFQVKCDFLAEQFTNYLDMAIGGELRHGKGQCSNLSEVEKSGTYIVKYIKSSSNGTRHSAWANWKKIRKTLDLDALRIAENIFTNGSWGSAYGGKKWGTATRVLLAYLTGESTKTMFVDTVWSLQHNNTYIQDKVWSVNDLKYILDAKFEGHIDYIVKFASPKVQELWNKFHGVSK